MPKLPSQFALAGKPRIRVISDNDYSGDPDGLVQLAHLLLSPTAEVRAIIGSHLRKDVPWPVAEQPATEAAQFAGELLDLCELGYDIPVLVGAEQGMTSATVPADSAAVDFIIAEAMRDDSDLPLYVVCGASLTSIASAYLREPRIADRLTVVWIGGHGYDRDVKHSEPEFNLSADIFAAQVVFNSSSLKVWQVPEPAYAATLVSKAEVIARMANSGPIGAYIWSKYEAVAKFADTIGLNFGEVYVFGDSPLTSLTVLQSALTGQSSSSKFVVRQAPKINFKGQYDFSAPGREIRVFEEIDTRLMVEDFFTKLQFKG